MHEYDENPIQKTLQQRKKWKFKKKFKIMLIIFFIFVILFFLMSDYSKVKSIEILGLETINEKDLKKSISLNESSYYFFINKKTIIKEIEKLSMVKHVNVQVDWLGHVQITIEEALPLASAKIDNKVYEINDAGKVTYITDQKRIQSLKVLPLIENFQSLNLLNEFAKEFKEVPSLMQNEISEIILEPRKADETRLKLQMKEKKVIYVRIEDISFKLNNDEFNYAAYKSEYKNKCTFSLEGEHIYLLPCE